MLDKVYDVVFIEKHSARTRILLKDNGVVKWRYAFSKNDGLSGLSHWCYDTFNSTIDSKCQRCGETLSDFWLLACKLRI